MSRTSVAIALWLSLCGGLAAGEGDEARRQERVEQLRARLAEVQAEERKLGGPSELPAAPPPGPSKGELQFQRARRAAAPNQPPEPPSPPPAAHERESAQLHDEPDAHGEASAPAHEEASAPAHEEAPSRARTPVQLGDAQLAADDATAALESYRRSAEEAEAAGEPGLAARARYGMARALERLGRSDEALKGYLAVEGLAAAGPWGKAARFARGWIAWRQRLEQLAPGRPAR